ncbi:MAG: potassium-transporting ATPase subunit KdpC [Dokdonella sp.]
MAIPSISTVPSRPAAPAVFDRGLLRGSIGLAVLAIVGFGFLYSLAGVGLGQVLFSDAANGSLIERDGKVIGSTLVAQPFTDDRYFSSRPSAVGHQPMSAGGSNQARTNPDLRKRVEEAVAAVALREGVEPSQVPGELVTQSGGGFDPHISPTGARIQVGRVARARGLRDEVVVKLVAEHTEAAQLGALGQPRVNVLELNLALDRETAAAEPASTTGTQ